MIEPKISLVIVNDDAVDYLPKFFNTIKEQGGFESLFEIIFLDNHSSDGSVEIAKNFGVKNVYVFDGKINKRGVLFQKGADLAKGDYVIFAHSDIYFGEGFFENLIKWLAENKDADFVNFGQYYVDGNFVNNHMALDLPNKKIIYSGLFDELANNSFLDCSEGCFMVKKDLFFIYGMSDKYRSNFFEFDLLKKARGDSGVVGRCDLCKFFHYFLENNEKVSDFEFDLKVFLRNNYDIFVLEERLTDISALSSVISQKEEKLIALDKVIHTKDKDIIVLGETVKKQDKKITILNETLEKKDKEIDAVREENLINLNNLLRQKDSDISVLNQQIIDLKKSLSYEIGRAFTFPIRVIFPVGSKRECILKIIKGVVSHPVKSLNKISLRELRRFTRALIVEHPSFVAENVIGFINGAVEHKCTNRFLNLKPKVNGEKAILVIDQNVPLYDQDAGSRTMYQYLKLFVKSGYKVIFLCAVEKEISNYVSKLNQIGVDVISGESVHCWQEFMLSNSEYFDYVFLNRAHIAINYIDFIKNNLKSKIIYNAVDFSYLREQRQYEITRDKAFLESAKESKKREFYIFKNSDAIITISDFEKNILKKEFPSKKVFIIPTFIYEKLPLGEDVNFDDREGLLFIGGFQHQPNVDGVLWFVKEVLPILRKKMPKLIVNIAGSNPPKKILKLKSKYLKVLGFVAEEQLSKLYSNTRLVMAPLRYGAGVKGKIIEGIAHGVPVITTSVGAEGIVDGDSLLRVGDSPNDFAKHIIDLYNNESEWNKIRNCELTYSKKFFSIENAFGIIVKIFK